MTNMEITEFMSDSAVLRELGRRLTRRRLDLQMTQEVLSRAAGVSKRTVERLEDGAAVQTSTLFRIYRALGLLGELDHLIPDHEERPMEILKLKGKTRQRASSPRKHDRSRARWKWGDER